MRHVWISSPAVLLGFGPFVMSAAIGMSLSAAHGAISDISVAAGQNVCSSRGNIGFCVSPLLDAPTLTTKAASGFESHHRWGLGEDEAGRSTSASVQHLIGFKVTARAGYRLKITVRRVGDINLVKDEAGCSTATADTSGITGVSSPLLSGGSLNLPDPGALTLGPGGSTSLPFEQTGTAEIVGRSDGAAVPVSLHFTWQASVQSGACEVAIRQGRADGPASCAACTYPGSPVRSAEADGHVVSVEFTDLCGNGVVDGVAAEQCDDGATNGTGASCCGLSCSRQPVGTPCDQGTCTDSGMCAGPPTTTTTTLPGVCGNSIVEPPEECDGGDCCRDCRLMPRGEICQSAPSCRTVAVCSGTTPDCPDLGYAPNGLHCVPLTEACFAGVCEDGICTALGRQRRSPCRVAAKSETVKRPQRERLIVVTCLTAEDSGCNARAFADATKNLRGTDDLTGAEITEIEPLGRETKRLRKGFRTRVRLRLNAFGRALLDTNDVRATVVVDVPERPGGVQQSSLLLKRLRATR